MNLGLLDRVGISGVDKAAVGEVAAAAERVAAGGWAAQGEGGEGGVLLVGDGGDVDEAAKSGAAAARTRWVCVTPPPLEFIGASLEGAIVLGAAEREVIAPGACVGAVHGARMGAIPLTVVAEAEALAASGAVSASPCA